MTRLVLASASPRRRALLAAVGREPDAVLAAELDETPGPAERPVALVRRLARAKRDVVAAAVAPTDVVLAADTVVVAGDELLGKPVDDADAARMLHRMAGAVVAIVSGLAVGRGGGDGAAAAASGVVLTLARFRDLSQDDVDAYVGTGEPRGAAGAFRLQGAGSRLIAATTGCPTNVVGMPVCEARRLLAPFGPVLASADCTEVVRRVRGA